VPSLAVTGTNSRVFVKAAAEALGLSTAHDRQVSRESDDRIAHGDQAGQAIRAKRWITHDPAARMLASLKESLDQPAPPPGGHDPCAGKQTKRRRTVAPARTCNVTLLLLCEPESLLSASMRTAVTPGGTTYSSTSSTANAFRMRSLSDVFRHDFLIIGGVCACGFRFIVHGAP